MNKTVQPVPLFGPRPHAPADAPPPPNPAAPPALGAANGTGGIEELIEQLEALPNASARQLAQQCLQGVVGLYGDALERILKLIRNGQTDGPAILDAMLRDELVRSLLLVHDLHPLDLETRLHRALEKIRPYMESHGGNVELIALEDGFARLRLQGACKTCPSSAVTLELAVRHAVHEACPDLLGFEVEGAPDGEAGRFEQAPPGSAADWIEWEEPDRLDHDSLVSTTVAGVPAVLCRLENHVFAYADFCPACHAPLDGATLADGVLQCAAGHSFDVAGAGRSLETPDLHLDPFPLLVENGLIKILPSPAQPYR